MAGGPQSWPVRTCDAASHDCTDTCRHPARHGRLGRGGGGARRRTRDDHAARHRRPPRPWPTRSRRRVRPRRGVGTPGGYRVRDRAGLRRARRAGRGDDRGSRDRRQRPGRDATRGSGAYPDDQLGRHRARPERVHVPPPGRFARGRVGAPGSARRHARCAAGGRGGRSLADRPSLRDFLRGRVRGTRPGARDAGVDRAVGRGRDQGSRVGARVRCRGARVPRPWSRRHCRRSGPHRRGMGCARSDEHGWSARSRSRVRGVRSTAGSTST